MVILLDNTINMFLKRIIIITYFKNVHRLSIYQKFTDKYVNNVHFCSNIQAMS